MDWIIFIAVKTEKAVTLSPLLPYVYNSSLQMSRFSCPIFPDQIAVITTYGYLDRWLIALSQELEKIYLYSIGYIPT